MKDIVTQLRANSECLAPSIMLEAADEIERLRKERDEARREICKNVAAISASMNAKQWAQERGWDCFKENT
jgi:uncharacterized coiled-coil DUF342 family protein